MHSSSSESFPKLLGDIGGTNVRLALQGMPEEAIGHVRTYSVADFDGLEAVVTRYLADVGASEGALRPHAGFLGIAGPVLGDHIQMFNAPWSFSIEALRKALGLHTLRILNDFTALALSLPVLSDEDLVQIGGEPPDRHLAKGLIGAGTGLGVSALVPTLDGAWAPMAGEGGHITLTPCSESEVRLLQVLWRRFPHVSAERVLSGSGLVVLYEAHAELAGKPLQPDAPRPSPSDIATRGAAGECPISEAALGSFCLFMGTVASNLAVTVGAQGGLYIGGGIVPKLGDFFVRSGFRERFDAKGRYSDYMRRIPVFVIHAEYPALVGASRA
jgi:glucokinase